MQERHHRAEEGLEKGNYGSHERSEITRIKGPKHVYRGIENLRGNMIIIYKTKCDCEVRKALLK